MMKNWQADIEAIARKAHDYGETLTFALRRVVDQYGYIDDAMIPLLADIYNLSKAEVLGVVSFYHDFRRQPVGRNVIKICRAEACQAVGGRALESHVKGRLQIDFGETTDDGALTLESVYCLGLCACGPAGQVNEQLVGHLDATAFDELFTSIKRGEKQLEGGEKQ